MNGITYDGYGRSLGYTPFGFGGQFGQYTEGGLMGLVLCTYRFYDTNTGRFVNRDPIGYAGGVNSYTSAKGNPVNFVDPLGLAEVYIGFNEVVLGNYHSYLLIHDNVGKSADWLIEFGPEHPNQNISDKVWRYFDYKQLGQLTVWNFRSVSSEYMKHLQQDDLVLS